MLSRPCVTKNTMQVRNLCPTLVVPHFGTNIANGIENIIILTNNFSKILIGMQDILIYFKIYIGY